MNKYSDLLLLFLLVYASSSLANPDEKVTAMGLVLKDNGKPPATFVYAVRTGNLLFLSGHISVNEKGEIIKGKLGEDLNTAQGAAAARLAGVAILSTIRQELGSLSKVEKFVKVTGMVNATPQFTEHSQVINGFSDLMVEVFGDNGQHARSAVGMGSLPLNAAVEIEVVLEIKQ